MNFSGEWIFVGMIFVAVFLLAQSLAIPAFGETRQARRRLRRRLDEVEKRLGEEGPRTLLRRRYRQDRSLVTRLLLRLPGAAGIEDALEQAGQSGGLGRFALLSFASCAAAGGLVWMLLGDTLWASPAAAVGLVLPYWRVQVARGKRIARFEEQLPDALNIITRALKAGHPFADALRLAGEDMSEPMATELRTTFSDANYGGDLRAALGGLLVRVPSVTVMALVTSVLVQRETGGNLSEILDKLGNVVRARFRFQRKVRTLSAEGRLSGWVLTLVPFVLVASLTLTSPSYLPMLTGDPLGRQIVAAAFVLMLLGILWVRRIIRIEV